MFKKLIIIILLFAVAACQNEETEWNPVFEDTGFGYFQSNVDKSLSLIGEISSSSAKKDLETTNKKIHEVKQLLLGMKDYYIPLTAIRQKIYDAERFYKIKNIEKSKKLLEESGKILDSIDSNAKNKVFDKVVIDLKTMINKALYSLDDKSESSTYESMKSLGEHINLMLFKGELILAGIEFSK